MKKDNKPYIVKYPLSTMACFDSHNSPSFNEIDKANSKFIQIQSTYQLEKT